MRNLEVQRVIKTRISLAGDDKLVHKCFAIADNNGAPCVYAISHSSSMSRPKLHCQKLNPLSTEHAQSPTISCPLDEYLAGTDDHPVALDVDPAGVERVLIGMRRGAVVAADCLSAAGDRNEEGLLQLIGEFVDEGGSQERNGVLAVRRSPDTALTVVVSPIKISLFSPDWDAVGEICFDNRIAVEADVSWRGDGAAFVVFIKDSDCRPFGFVIDRDMSSWSPLDVNGVADHHGLSSVDSRLLASAKLVNGDSTGDHVVVDDHKSSDSGFQCCVSWQPRIGGIITIPGPGRSMWCFERNGLRHLRNDYIIMASGERDSKDNAECDDEFSGARIIAWSCDSSMLAVAAGRLYQDTGSEGRTVDIYTRSNYHWSQKMRLMHGSTVVEVCWDVDSANIVHVAEQDGCVTSYRLNFVYSRALLGDAAVAVVDGSSVRLTNFSNGIVPPPLCHETLTASHSVVAACFLDVVDSDANYLGALTCEGHFELLEYNRESSCVCEDQFTEAAVARDLPRMMRWKLLSPSYADKPITSFRFPLLLSENLLLTVCAAPFSESSAPKDHLHLFVLDPAASVAEKVGEISMQSQISALQRVDFGAHDIAVVVACEDTSLHEVVLKQSQDAWSLESRRQWMSSHTSVVSLAADLRSNSAQTFALALLHDDGALEVIDCLSNRSVTLSSGCTSFCVTNGFLLLTTRSHLLHCIAIESVGSPSEPGRAESIRDMLATAVSRPGMDGTVHSNATKIESEGISMIEPRFVSSRPIDRGSTIVTAIQTDVRIILQAPRGNLETVAPRPLVLRQVSELSKAKEYGRAFALSRQQRVDMSVMVDLNFDVFMHDIDLFVKQVSKPSHLSVFLTFLQGSDERVNCVCEAVVESLLRQTSEADVIHYFPTILTAMIRHKPPMYQDALRFVQDCTSKDEKAGFSALDFLQILVKDQEKLYDEALGSYDLRLALMVAKTSDMEQAEYLDELRALRKLSEGYRRHAIDMRLGRHESALKHLFSCGEQEKQTCLDLAKAHCLYVSAIELFRHDQGALTQLRSQYAEHLRGLNRYEDAAIVSVQNGDWQEAAFAYKEAGKWEFALSSFSRADEQKMKHLDSSSPENSASYSAQRTALWRDFVRSVCDRLLELGQGREAARLGWYVLNDLDRSLEDACCTQNWETAFEIVAGFAAASGDRIRADRARDYVGAELREAADSLHDDLLDTSSKMREKTARLLVLRNARAKMRETVGNTGQRGTPDNDGDSDIFSVSTRSSLSSAASDASFASSTASHTSKTSLYASVGKGGGGRNRAAAARRAAKAARKRVRTGDPREEGTLELSLKQLVPNDLIRKRAASIVRALSFSNMNAISVSILAAYEAVLDECRKLPEDIRQSPETAEVLSDGSLKALFERIGLIN